MQLFARQDRFHVGAHFIRQSEDPFHPRHLSPGAHQRRIRPAAQQQVHGIDNDGLARARLAGEDHKARRKLQFEMINDGKIGDDKFGDHL